MTSTEGKTDRQLHFEALRRWAKGSYPLEAGVELLIRVSDGRFALVGNPWIRTEDGNWSAEHGNAHWVDFDAIPDHLGPLSSGERAVLELAASIGGNHQVDIGDKACRLDRGALALVLAAIAHAAGSHSHSDMILTPDGEGHMSYELTELGSLHPWPAEETAS